MIIILIKTSHLYHLYQKLHCVNFQELGYCQFCTVYVTYKGKSSFTRLCIHNRLAEVTRITPSGLTATPSEQYTVLYLLEP